MNQVGNLETTPEKALVASYIIKLLNRNASAKVDRLLKQDYDEVKRNPLILDTILRAQLLAFFSSIGSINITKELMKYYRDYELYSALLDAKNLLVICSKENIDNSATPFNGPMSKVVQNLIAKEKGYIVKKHVKSALASCILTGNLGEDFDNLMEGKLIDAGLDPELSEYLKNTCLECQKELKERIKDSVPKESRVEPKEEENKQPEV